MSRLRILRQIRCYGTQSSNNSSSNSTSFLTLSRKRIQSKNIQIIGVRNNHYENAMEFMNKHFLDDPLIAAMKVPNDDETFRIMSAVWMPAIKQNLSLHMTKQKSDTDPKILGVCVNSVHDSEAVYRTLVETIKSTKSQPLQNLLNAWALITVQPKFTNLPPKSIFEISGIAVDKEFRRLGIANQLLDNAVVLAKLKGYYWVRVDCTSPHSARICENSGFYLIYEKHFKEFDGIGLNGVSKERVKVYVKPLRKKKNPKSILLPFNQI